MEKRLTFSKEIPGAFTALFILFILALFFDAFATSLFMLRHGWQFEINPLVRWGAALYGPVYGPFLGALLKVAGGIFLAWLHRRATCYVLLLTSVISVAAGFYNIVAFTISLDSLVYHLPL